MKYDLIVADPPWEFSDQLTMSETPRGSASQYSVLDIEEIKKLEVSKLAADSCVLVLWVPSAMLQDGLDAMKNWGFEQKQTFVWVKVKQTDGKSDPLKILHKQIIRSVRGKWPIVKTQDRPKRIWTRFLLDGIEKLFNEFDINDILSMYLGRLFRQTHEIALIGIKGRIYDKMEVKNQRSVLLDRNIGHSSKPEGLQDRLDLMFPKFNKLEMFARRDRPGWTCVGWECPSTPKEDIRDSIKRLEKV